MLTSIIAGLVLSLPCAEQPVEGLPGVSVTSAFAHDAGCVVTHFTVDGTKYEDFSHALPALAKGGWSAPKKRTAIALTWINAVSEEDLQDLKAKLLDDGSVRLDAWYKPRPGMRPRPADAREYLKVRIGVDGVLGPVKDQPKSP